MDKKETVQILATLRGAYPNFYRAISKQEAVATVALWERMFADYDYKIVDAAVAALIASDETGYPPVIGQVMAKIRFLTQPRAMDENEAWFIVYKAICNSAYDSVSEFEKLPPEIKSLVHGPDQLREWAIDPDFNIGVESSNFKRVFRARAAQAREFNALPSSVKQYAIGNGFVSLDQILGITEGDSK